ncbi:hypothetical protein JB92DRAFT_2704994, partial [Gautieria morchelliformis]
RHGYLVILLSPLEPTRTVCKRVIDLPGDTICVHPDKAIQFRRPTSRKHVVVPEAHVWTSGDNMANSRDSRVDSPIPNCFGTMEDCG